MRKSSYILYNIALLLTMTAALMTACTSDHAEELAAPTDKEPSNGHDIQLVTYTNYYIEQNSQRRAAPSGFTPYTPDKKTDMGIYMLLPDPDNPNNWLHLNEEKITYTNKWHAYFDVTPDKTYTVYGYMPKTGDMSSTLTGITANAATLTISNIKPVTTDDICIITGVKETDEGLKEGQFSWKWPIGDDNYRIYLLMDHLYAAAQFRLKIDVEYAKLRTIKLKTMTLSTDNGNVNATITLTHNTTGTSPISNETYTAASGSNNAVLIYNNDEGTALDKTITLDINAYFAPTLSGSLTLVSSYDVYDKNNNLIRANCEATNKLPNLEVVRGQRGLVNMTVNPSYLYVLSDPDLDNPTVVVN